MLSYKNILYVLYFHILHVVKPTIDMNLSELQHVANHLHPHECRKLIAVLHFQTYEIPRGLDEAERNVPKDIPCIQMLLHWNSAAGEGRGQTHEVLFHRLNQIGRHDLAEWLGKQVFRDLGNSLERSLDDPFREFAEDTEVAFRQRPQPTFAYVDESDPTEWWALDTICYTIIAGLILTTFVVLGIILYKICYNKREIKKRKRIKFAKRQYEQIDNFSEESDSESEERFNVRKHIDDV